MSSSMYRIIIGFGTIGRATMLQKTLDSLLKIIIPESYTVEVVVVDNAPNEETKKTILSYQKKTIDLTFTYLEESRRGIVFMRNTILDYAVDKDVTILAYIDDDEFVKPEWLTKMLNTKEQFEADVVVGRVERELPADSPKWVRKGRFFERPSMPTGTVRKAASTSNVLFDLKYITQELGLKFHPALNISGSSDTYLFTKASEKGAKIVWLNENLVFESIPESRIQVGWLLKRAFRHTNCRVIRKRLDDPYLKVVMTEGCYGFLHFLLSLFSIPINIFRGKAGLVHTLRFFYKGMGSFAGLAGYHYQEYSKIHGY